MTRGRRTALTLAVLMAVLMTALPWAAQAQPPPPMADLGTLGTDSSPAAVNAHGQIVGENSFAPVPLRRAFSWTIAGGMIDLGTLGAFTSSYAVGVNDAGRVIGNSYTDWGSQDSRAFSWTAAEGMIELGTLGGIRSEASAVNASGQVVGFSSRAAGDWHAFLWTPAGGMIGLGTLGGDHSRAEAVNAGGQVVGYSSTAFLEGHAFSWTAAGGMIDLGTLGGRGSIAFAVSELGQVVGESLVVDEVRHAFSWTAEGGMIDIGSFGGYGVYVGAINASGQVVGMSVNVEGRNRAFSWTAAGGMTDLGPLPGGIASSANALNDSGQVVGISQTLMRHRAVYWMTVPNALRITTPNAESRWGVGTLQRLSWTYAGEAPQFQIDISRDGGRNWDYLTTAANAAGSSQNFDWRVTSPLTMVARFRITAIADPGSSDVNDANIRIANATVEILSPTATTTVPVGAVLKIGIKHSLGARAPIAIEVSHDNGGSWRTAAETRTTGSTTSSFQWTVDLPPTTRARVRVRALDGTGAKATSSAFTVR